MALKHAFTSLKSDGTDATLVRPSDWNADHVGTYQLPAYTTATRPTPDSSWAGIAIYVRDAASPATMQLCMQNSDNTWSWVIVAMAPL